MSKPDSYTQLLDGMACEQQYQQQQQKLDQASKIPDDFERIKATSSLNEQWLSSGCAGKEKPLGTSSMEVIFSKHPYKKIEQQWWESDVLGLSIALTVGVIAGMFVMYFWKKRHPVNKAKCRAEQS